MAHTPVAVWLIAGLAIINISSPLPSPIFDRKRLESEGNREFSTEFCPLPDEMGKEGTIQFIEDCDSLHQVDYLPKPSFKKVGVHPLVCCPKLIHDTAICFPSDAWCPTYVPPPPPDYSDYGPPPGEGSGAPEDYEGASGQGPPSDYSYEDYDYGDYVNDYDNILAERICSNDTTECVGLSSCGPMLDSDTAPLHIGGPCGFDKEKSELMLCCPKEQVEAQSSNERVPRFPDSRGRARKCEDRHKMCRTWADRGGCSLDKGFILSELRNDSFVAKTNSKDMHFFMSAACPESCGLCGKKGCVDEHPRCEKWVNTNMCLNNPDFMVHSCRESCGVCGFLSPFSKEMQVIDELSYTDIAAEDFDCGRDKPRCERIEGVVCGEKEKPLCEHEDILKPTTAKPQPSTEAPDTAEDSDEFDLRSSDIFFASDPESKSFCTNIQITDRWALSAGHCYDDYGDTKYDSLNLVHLRENTETVEIKKVYQHPNYIAGESYYDIALLELGRRITENYTLHGTTPDCLDEGLPIENQEATGEGFGKIACKFNGEIKEFSIGEYKKFNVTVLDQNSCKGRLDSNERVTRSDRRKIDNALPHGFTEGLFCAVGEEGDDGIFSGACKGDSGAPMKIRDGKERLNLIGLVSGGISCGRGIPGWNTRLSYFRRWIICIINTSRRNNGSYSKTNKVCNRLIQERPKCEDRDPIFGSVGIDNNCV